MITIHIQPPWFHTLFNPVIFELRSIKELKTLAVTINKIPLPGKELDPKDSVRTNIVFEKVSGEAVYRAHFDARHFLAPLFGQLERPANQTICDEYQSFQYTMVLEGTQHPVGPFSVLRSVAQVGESHSLELQRYRLLTGLKLLRVYEGYPCDVSLLCPDKGSYLYNHPENGELEIPLIPNRVNRLIIDCYQRIIGQQPRVSCKGMWDKFVCQKTPHDFVFEWQHVPEPGTPTLRCHTAGHLLGSAIFDLMSMKDGSPISYRVVDSTCPNWISIIVSDLKPDSIACHWQPNDSNYPRTARIEIIQSESGKKIYLEIEQERVEYLFRWQEHEMHSALEDTEELLHLSLDSAGERLTKDLHSFKGASPCSYKVVEHPEWISPLDNADNSLSFSVTRLNLGFGTRNARVVLRQEESGKEIELIVEQQAEREKCRGRFENFICQEVKEADYIPIYTIDDLQGIHSTSNPGWLPYVLMNDIDYNGVEFRSLYWEGIRFYGQGFAFKNIIINKGQDISVVNCLLQDVCFEQIETRDTGYFLFASSSDIVNCHFWQIQCIRQWPGWMIYCDKEVAIRFCSFRQIDIRAIGVPSNTSQGAGYSAIIGMGGNYNVVEDVYADSCLGKVHWDARYRAGLVSSLSTETTNNLCRRAVVDAVLLSVPDEISTENTGSGGIASLCEVQDSVLVGGSMQVASEANYAASAGRIQGHIPGSYPYSQSFNNYASESFGLLGRVAVSDRNGIDGETVSVVQTHQQSFYESLGYNFSDGWRMGNNQYPEPWKEAELFKVSNTPSGHALAQDYRYTLWLGDYLLQDRVYSLLEEWTDDHGRVWPALDEEDYKYLRTAEILERAGALLENLGQCDDYLLENQAVDLDSSLCIDYQLEWHPEEIDHAANDDEENLYITVEKGTEYKKMVLSFKNNLPQEFEITSAPDWFIPLEVTTTYIRFQIIGQVSDGGYIGEVVLNQKGSEEEIYLHIRQESCSIEFFDFVCQDESLSVSAN